MLGWIDSCIQPGPRSGKRVVGFQRYTDPANAEAKVLERRQKVDELNLQRLAQRPMETKFSIQDHTQLAYIALFKKLCCTQVDVSDKQKIFKCVIRIPLIDCYHNFRASTPSEFWDREPRIMVHVPRLLSHAYKGAMDENFRSNVVQIELGQIRQRVSSTRQPSGKSFSVNYS